MPAVVPMEIVHQMQSSIKKITTLEEWILAVLEELNRRGNPIAKAKLAKLWNMNPAQLANAYSKVDPRFPKNRLYNMLDWAIKESIYPNELIYVILERYCPGAINLLAKPSLVNADHNCVQAFQRAVEVSSSSEVKNLLTVFTEAIEQHGRKKK
jgi:hypothetical protein